MLLNQLMNWIDFSFQRCQPQDFNKQVESVGRTLTWGSRDLWADDGPSSGRCRRHGDAGDYHGGCALEIEAACRPIRQEGNTETGYRL